MFRNAHPDGRRGIKGTVLVLLQYDILVTELTKPRSMRYAPMKKLILILCSILLSAPLSAFLSVGTAYLLTEPVTVQGYHFNPPIWATAVVVAVYEIPFYIIVGIPVTYLIDYLIKKFSPEANRLKEYSYLFLGYFIAALLLSVSLLQSDIEGYLTVFIPVFVYFHILWGMRLRFG
ncbi:hypothetical protein [Rossellomorea sp. KS-H15a]|uniref:hypothetical protein n=1 Tax=Rossellomorea sp. KS-H15a TaxID=2963940 RepID=UPI0020C6E23E|nr:hypothetical protein [Rossellomorea sp. KS-H15a]UTE77440.1 hypothetical protein M1J35_01065 [Rossellomorea sp. KS-H15a]